MPYAEVLDCDLKFTSSTSDVYGSTWYACSGTTAEYYLDGDSAQTDRSYPRS